MKSERVTISWTLKTLVVMAFCFSFGVLTPNAPMLSSAAKAQDPKVQPKTQKIQLAVNKARAKQSLHQANAGKYDTAIRNISALERAPLKTEADVKKAIDTLQKNRIKADMVFGKGVTLAVNVNSFKAGVEAEATRLSPKLIITQIKQKSLSPSRIVGFNDVKTTLKRQFDGDAAMLRRVSKRLEQASRQRGLARLFPTPPGRNVLVAQGANRFLGEGQGADPFLSAVSHRFTPASSAMDSSIWADGTSSEPQGEVIIVSGGVALTIILFIVLKRIVDYCAANKCDIDAEPDYPDDDQNQPSRFDACMGHADSKLDGCLDRNKDDLWAQGGCWATWALDKAACLTLVGQ